MWQTILLAVALLGGGDAGKQVYTGPNALGPFRIDRDISMNSLFEKLGRPPKLARDTFCYQSKDGRAYLALTRMDAVYDDKIAGAVLLSDFRNCVDRPVQPTSEDLMSWKTEKGIGLGSSTEEVIRAYGKPSSVDRLGTDYRGIIRGTPEQSRKRPELGTTIMNYTGASGDLRAAFLGIRDGKVAWISLSTTE